MAVTLHSLPEKPMYPSFQELKKDNKKARFSAAMSRLYWPLDDEFPSKICVMRQSQRNTSELEPFFQTRTDTKAINSGTWHEIASLPLTEPMVSFVEASVYDLDQWDILWVETHEVHDSAEYVSFQDLSEENRSYVSLQNEDSSQAEGHDAKVILRCCGEDRPFQKQGLKLKVGTGTGNSFVTVFDYISAVHPWLMSMRGDLSKAMAAEHPYSIEVDESILMVDNHGGPAHCIVSKQYFHEMNDPPQTPDTSTRRIIERIRARKAR